MTSSAKRLSMRMRPPTRGPRRACARGATLAEPFPVTPGVAKSPPAAGWPRKRLERKRIGPVSRSSVSLAAAALESYDDGPNVVRYLPGSATAIVDLSAILVEANAYKLHRRERAPLRRRPAGNSRSHALQWWRTGRGQRTREIRAAPGWTICIHDLVGDARTRTGARGVVGRGRRYRTSDGPRS